MPDLSGTNIERRINKVCEDMASKRTKSAVYSLKETTLVNNFHEFRYNETQLESIKKENAENLSFFGYTNISGPKNSTGFFDFPNPTKA